MNDVQQDNLIHTLPVWSAPMTSSPSGFVYSWVQVCSERFVAPLDVDAQALQRAGGLV